MTENQQTIDTLLAENYGTEQALSYPNRKFVSKMFRYIRTFPLSEYDTECIRKDILGMAAEAEQRGESIASVIDKKPKDFCNDLLYAIANIKAPRGYQFLRAAGWWYEVNGWFTAVNAFLGIGGLIMALLNSGTLLDGSKLTLVSVCWFLLLPAAAFIFITAGRRAKRYCGDVTKASSALLWGIGVAVFEFVYSFLDSILSGHSGIPASDPFPGGSLNAVFIFLAVAVTWGFRISYIIGALLNKKDAKNGKARKNF